MAQKKKWQVVEGVVAALEEALKAPGACVTRNARVRYRDDPKRTRQVDVHVQSPAGPRSISIAIEVKHESRPLSVEMVEQVEAKLSKLDVDRRCLVSTSGFSAAARADAGAKGLELLTMEQLTEVEWWAGPLTMDNVLRQVEVLAVSVDFDSDDLEVVRRLLPKFPSPDRVMLTQSDGRRFSVREVAIHHGIKTLERPEVRALPHGARVDLAMTQEPPWSAIEIEDRSDLQLPVPKRLRCAYRLHLTHAVIETHAFDLHDRQAISTTLTVGDQEVQLTMVGRSTLDGGVEDFRTIASIVPKKPRRVGEARAKKTARAGRAPPPPTGKRGGRRR